MDDSVLKETLSGAEKSRKLACPRFNKAFATGRDPAGIDTLSD